MKRFENGKWVEAAEKPYSPTPEPKPAKVLKDGQWIGGEEEPKEEKKFVDPRDVEPQPPKAPVDDADRPRWIAENVRYLEALSNYRARQTFKAEHPELKNISWHVKTQA